jgi:hypothetical protein
MVLHTFKILNEEHRRSEVERADGLYRFMHDGLRARNVFVVWVVWSKKTAI